MLFTPVLMAALPSHGVIQIPTRSLKPRFSPPLPRPVRVPPFYLWPIVPFGSLLKALQISSSSCPPRWESPSVLEPSSSLRPVGGVLPSPAPSSELQETP